MTERGAKGMFSGWITAVEGTQDVDSIFERARVIIQTARIHPDPVGAMKRLEAEAPEDEKVMFPMLWEGLVLMMNETPT